MIAPLEWRAPSDEAKRTSCGRAAAGVGRQCQRAAEAAGAVAEMVPPAGRRRCLHGRDAGDTRSSHRERRLGARDGLRAPFLQPGSRWLFLRRAGRDLSRRCRCQPAAPPDPGGARRAGQGPRDEEVEQGRLARHRRRGRRRLDRSPEGRQRAAPARAVAGPPVRVARFHGRRGQHDRLRGRTFFQIAEDEVMAKPRIHILALGGTIATRPDASGAMQMGLGADDLIAAAPLLSKVADLQAETVSRVGSHSLGFDQIHALAAKIRTLKADGVVVTQGTDTLEETSFLLDVLLDLEIPVIVTAAMRNPALTSPDGPGNLLAAVRVSADPWVRKHARALGVIVVMLDEVYGAADVVKAHGTRLNAFVSPQTGPAAALVEDRVVPLSLPARDAMVAAHARLGTADGKAAPVALFWMSLDESGRLIEMMLAASDRVGYRGAVISAMGGGHTPERATESVIRLAQAMPTVVASRTGGGPMLRQTYGGPTPQIPPRQAPPLSRRP